MYLHSYSPERQPLFHVGKLPVHMVTLLVIAHAAIMLFFAFAGREVSVAAAAALGFTPEAVFAGRFWTPVSYAFLSFPGFWPALGLVFFFLFGRRIEDEFGRNFFALSYFWIVLVSAALVLLIDLAARVFGGAFSWPLYGPQAVHFAFFIGFCILEPEARFFGMFPAKWFGTFFVVVQSAALLHDRMLSDLVALWTGIILLYVFMRRAGLPARFSAIGRLLPRFRAAGRKGPRDYRRSRSRLKVVPRRAGSRVSATARKLRSYEPKLKPKANPPRSSRAAASVDHLLEKISRDGLSSLTDEERQILHQASDRLSGDRESG